MLNRNYRNLFENSFSTKFQLWFSASLFYLILFQYLHHEKYEKYFKITVYKNVTWLKQTTTNKYWNFFFFFFFSEINTWLLRSASWFLYQTTNLNGKSANYVLFFKCHLKVLKRTEKSIDPDAFWKMVVLGSLVTFPYNHSWICPSSERKRVQFCWSLGDRYSWGFCKIDFCKTPCSKHSINI